MKNAVESRKRKQSFLPKLILAAVLFIAAFLFLLPRAQRASAEPAVSIPPGATYNKLWNKVDSLSDAGLYRSARELADLILEKARKEKEDVQLVKALVCRYKMTEQYQEESSEWAIYDAEAELKNLKSPAKQVLHSMLAEMYWDYYRDHRWEFYSRTQTTEAVSDSINTWDLARLTDKSIKHYQASVIPADSLKKIPTSRFDDVIIKGEETRKLRPTLYDFLAHRAISFFQSEEPSVARPAERFTISRPEFFGDLKVFNNLTDKFPTGDTFAMRYYAYRSYQQLLAFRLRDTAVSALIDADRLRIEFVYANYSGEKKNALYESALRRLAKEHPKNPESARVLFTLAEHYSDLASSYRADGNQEHRWKYKDAVLLCDSIIAAYPETDGAENSKELRNTIRRKTLTFEAEEVIIPNQSFPGLVKLTNIDSIYFRVSAIDPEQVFKNEKERTDYYLAQPVLNSWSAFVPSDNDYRGHSAQLAFPALPAGNYVMLASPVANFNDTAEDHLLAYRETEVSSIAYLKRNLNSKDDEYLLINRLTGAPLVKASVEILRRKYSSEKGTYEYKYAYTETSDKDGRVIISNSKIGTDSYVLDIRWNGEKFRTEYDYDYWYSDYEEEEKPETFFFLDRAIYRPGQTVFFKGIMVEKKKGESKILVNEKTTVSFYDPNQQEISSLEVTTNEFGSFSGSFVIPNNGITGSMSISCESGSEYFSVEEYKRPKFEIVMDKLNGQYVLGDSVIVTGKAKTFTGSPLDQATVRYKVNRRRYIYYWREDTDELNNTLLAEGTVIANDTGGFRFSFKASPEEKSTTDYETVYFSIGVDVTDISGETHSEEKSISLGKKALQINSGLSNYRELSKEDSLYISVTNMDYNEVYSDVDVKICRLEKPERLLRQRQWEKADKFVYSKEAWAKLFPEDLYEDENEQLKWKHGATVFTAKYNTKSNKALYLAGEEKWTAGAYYYECTLRDKMGNTITSEGYFSRFASDEKKADPSEAYTFHNIKTDCEPGEKAVFSFATPIKNANLLVEAKSNGAFVYRKWIKPGEELKEIEIPVTEACRGGMNVVFTLVHNNRFYNFSQNVWVPRKDDKKEIEIVFETFRDKLSPGQKEEWRIKIKGDKGEKVAAEMVATMYDASLDEFAANNWSFYPWSYYSDYSAIWNNKLGDSRSSSLLHYSYYWWPSYSWPSYDEFNWYGFMNEYRWFRGNRFGIVNKEQESDSSKIGYQFLNESTDSIVTISKLGAISGAYNVTVTDANGASVNFSDVQQSAKVMDGVISTGQSVTLNATGSTAYMWSFENNMKLENVKARKKLGETVFFYPHLTTDSEGSIIISFTMNEALSKWKLMTFAHTKDLRYTQETREIVTQKELMVMPNAPRFFREGDQITFTARVANMSEKDLEGTAQLMLFDATTMKPVDVQFGNDSAQVKFAAKKGQGAALSWNLHIPQGIGAVIYRVVASSGNFSDGEENAIPVLSNRILVTETLPLSIMGNQSKDFRFEKLISQNGGSTSLRNERLTLEFTSNPAWYAVQSLPYMMEYPYECAEQTFSRYYSNSIASNIANSSPKIRSVFDAWKNQSPDAFLSNLEKNPELKSLMLTETPWVLEAKDESERKRRVGLLFDVNHMADETGRTFRKLQELQYENGAWPWFENMPEDRFITQYIVCGFGHLDHLGVKDMQENEENKLMIEKAIHWLDGQMRKDYADVLKYHATDKDKDHIGYYAIQYLYARSYFPETSFNAGDKEAFDYYLGQAKKYWTGKGRYMEGMLALSLNRYKETKTANDILKSLGETALHSGEMGMYWKDNSGGWYWHQAVIETQALLIEAFKEVKNDTKSVDEMRVWLLKNKQTNDWKTTKATAEACYALLLDGTDWLATESDVTIIVGSQPVDLKKTDVKEEAGTGYFKTSWSGTEIKAEMGNVKVTKAGPGVSWGSMYWQYFEELDKITPAQSPLKVSRKLFLQKKTSAGIVLEPVTETTVLHPGDQLKVRIELKNDREMEYVHLKDMRASGFEPVNVFSQYKYQDGLGYYESTKDASTDFFFSYLPKGAHVFEYPLTVIHAGNFSMGVTNVDCMYAPEFAAHSEGLRVLVK